MKIVDGTYLNRGGSKILIQELIDRLGDNAEVFFLLDKRITPSKYPKSYSIISPSERARLKFYKEHKSRCTRVLCMGNVPPPIKLSCPVVTYFHNRLLLEPSKSGAGFATKFLLHLKLAYIRLKKNNTTAFAVQTQGLGKALQNALKCKKTPICIWPFWPAITGIGPSRLATAENTFGYVSLPYPHKNHIALINAWNLLAQKDIRPELHLTVPPDWPNVLSAIEQANASGARIFNHGFCNPADIYSICTWQIYPSSSESFGLGLIESVEAGCKVLAPELEYVREVIEPSMTWQGKTCNEIAKAVEEALKRNTGNSTIHITNEIHSVISFILNTQTKK